MKQMEVDALLRPYLEAESEAEAQLLLATLLSEQVEPLVQSIVARKLGFSSRLQQEETADVRGEIILQLLHRLQAMRRDPSTPPIENLKAYTVVTSFRGCAAYLRRRYPRRAQLLNRVQYVLTRYPQFGLWQKEGDWWSGMAHWVNDLQTRQLLSEFQLDQLLSPALPPSLYGVPDATLRRVSAPDQVAAIFHWAERFVTLDDLVLILAHWWEVKDSSLASEQITAQAEPAFLRPETQIEQRLYLQKLWQEIQALPVRQRCALLLPLRSEDGHSVLPIFPVLQIASIRQLANAMGLTPEELAALWQQLPLDDAKLAKLMNITRRQVVNLRKAARARLSRKMRDW